MAQSHERGGCTDQVKGEDMDRKYYINGFQYGRSYWRSIFGRETSSDMEVFRNGDTIIRNGNEFYIEEVEDPD